MNPDDEQYKFDFEASLKNFDEEDWVGDSSHIKYSFEPSDSDPVVNVGFDYGVTEEGHNKMTEMNNRLKRIETVLGIPKDLERNKEMEEKHPHLKEMAEAYNLAVEQHITLELLTPPVVEEEEDIPF